MNLQQILINTFKTQNALMQLASRMLVEACDMAYSLARFEVVDAMMKAYNITKPSAEARYSRLKEVIHNEDLRKQILNKEVELSMRTTSKLERKPNLMRKEPPTISEAMQKVKAQIVKMKAKWKNGTTNETYSKYCDDLRELDACMSKLSPEERKLIKLNLKF